MACESANVFKKGFLDLLFLLMIVHLEQVDTTTWSYFDSLLNAVYRT